MNILINEAFKANIIPLADAEFAQLEANIIADGCRDPLVVWPCAEFVVDVEYEDGAIEPVTLRFTECEWDQHCGESEDHTPYRTWDADGEFISDECWPRILVDGHNRLAICQKHGIPFTTVDKEFDSDDHAMLWMHDNQDGRRNYSDYNRGVMALRRKDIVARMAKARMVAGVAADPVQNSAPGKTRDIVAESAGLSHDTLRKIEKIEAQAPAEVKALAAAEEVSIHLASQFVELPAQAQREAVDAIAISSTPAREVIREAVHNHRAQGTGENEWYTPAEYIEAAREVLGEIDLDPASSEVAQAKVRAKTFYTIDDDGLQQAWAGRVWLNPPYAQPAIRQFIEKLCSSVARGGCSASPHIRIAEKMTADVGVSEAILLTHNYTDTGWFHIAAEHATAICFTRGRIGFLSPDGKKAAPTQGQSFFYFGRNHQAFADVFRRFGFVVEVTCGYADADRLDSAA